MKNFSVKNAIFGVLVVLIVALNLYVVTEVVFPNSVIASSIDTKSITNIDSGSTSGADTVTKMVDNWITTFRVIGVALLILAVILGAIVFGFSLGNSQKRGIGIASMVSAFLAIIVIAKANVLAGWVLKQ